MIASSGHAIYNFVIHAKIGRISKFLTFWRNLLQRRRDVGGRSSNGTASRADNSAHYGSVFLERDLSSQETVQRSIEEDLQPLPHEPPVIINCFVPVGVIGKMHTKQIML